MVHSYSIKLLPLTLMLDCELINVVTVIGQCRVDNIYIDR